MTLLLTHIMEVFWSFWSNQEIIRMSSPGLIPALSRRGAPCPGGDAACCNDVPWHWLPPRPSAVGSEHSRTEWMVVTVRRGTSLGGKCTLGRLLDCSSFRATSDSELGRCLNLPLFFCVLLGFPEMPMARHWQLL